LLLDCSGKSSSGFYERVQWLGSKSQRCQAKANDGYQILEQEAKIEITVQTQVSTIAPCGIGIRPNWNGGGFGASSSTLQPI
jgi:hypothetical protein